MEDELPDIGDKIITRKGGQNQGVVVDIEDDYMGIHILFKHENGKTYRTPLRNVKVLEKAIDEDLTQQQPGQPPQPNQQPGQPQQGQPQTAQQQSQAAAGLNALKTTTNTTTPLPQLAQTLDKAATGASMTSGDTTKLGNIMKGIEQISKDPQSANQFGQLINKATQN